MQKSKGEWEREGDFCEDQQHNTCLEEESSSGNRYRHSSSNMAAEETSSLHTAAVIQRIPTTTPTAHSSRLSTSAATATTTGRGAGVVHPAVLSAAAAAMGIYSQELRVEQQLAAGHRIATVAAAAEPRRSAGNSQSTASNGSRAANDGGRAAGTTSSNGVGARAANPRGGNTSSSNALAEQSEAGSTDDSFVPSLAIVLQHLVTISPERGEVTNFHAVKEPEISIHDYLERISRYFGCSNECFVLSLVYIDRILKLHRNFNVSLLNIHRLIITSVMLAAKFFDDIYYSNQHYARVGGVRTREMNLLEIQFLAMINYNLFVSPREYEQYRRNVMAAVQYARHLAVPTALLTRNSYVGRGGDSAGGGGGGDGGDGRGGGGTATAAGESNGNNSAGRQQLYHSTSHHRSSSTAGAPSIQQQHQQQHHQRQHASTLCISNTGSNRNSSSNISRTSGELVSRASQQQQQHHHTSHHATAAETQQQQLRYLHGEQQQQSLFRLQHQQQNTQRYEQLVQQQRYEQQQQQPRHCLSQQQQQQRRADQQRLLQREANLSQEQGGEKKDNNRGRGAGEEDVSYCVPHRHTTIIHSRYSVHPEQHMLSAVPGPAAERDAERVLQRMNEEERKELQHSAVGQQQRTRLQQQQQQQEGREITNLQLASFTSVAQQMLMLREKKSAGDLRSQQQQQLPRPAHAETASARLAAMKANTAAAAAAERVVVAAGASRGTATDRAAATPAERITATQLQTLASYGKSLDGNSMAGGCAPGKYHDVVEGEAAIEPREKEDVMRYADDALYEGGSSETRAAVAVESQCIEQRQQQWHHSTTAVVAPSGGSPVRSCSRKRIFYPERCCGVSMSTDCEKKGTSRTHEGEALASRFQYAKSSSTVTDAGGFSSLHFASSSTAASSSASLDAGDVNSGNHTAAVYHRVIHETTTIPPAAQSLPCSAALPDKYSTAATAEGGGLFGTTAAPVARKHDDATATDYTDAAVGNQQNADSDGGYASAAVAYKQSIAAADDYYKTAVMADRHKAAAVMSENSKKATYFDTQQRMYTLQQQRTCQQHHLPTKGGEGERCWPALTRMRGKRIDATKADEVCCCVSSCVTSPSSCAIPAATAEAVRGTDASLLGGRQHQERATAAEICCTRHENTEEMIVDQVRQQSTTSEYTDSAAVAFTVQGKNERGGVYIPHQHDTDVEIVSTVLNKEDVGDVCTPQYTDSAAVSSRNQGVLYEARHVNGVAVASNLVRKEERNVLTPGQMGMFLRTLPAAVAMSREGREGSNVICVKRNMTECCSPSVTRAAASSLLPVAGKTTHCCCLSKSGCCGTEGGEGAGFSSSCGVVENILNTTVPEEENEEATKKRHNTIPYVGSKREEIYAKGRRDETLQTTYIQDERETSGITVAAEAAAVTPPPPSDATAAFFRPAQEGGAGATPPTATTTAATPPACCERCHPHEGEEPRTNLESCNNTAWSCCCCAVTPVGEGGATAEPREERRAAAAASPASSAVASFATSQNSHISPAAAFATYRDSHIPAPASPSSIAPGTAAASPSNIYTAAAYAARTSSISSAATVAACYKNSKIMSSAANTASAAVGSSQTSSQSTISCITPSQSEHSSSDVSMDEEYSAVSSAAAATTTPSSACNSMEFFMQQPIPKSRAPPSSSQYDTCNSILSPLPPSSSVLAPADMQWRSSEDYTMKEEELTSAAASLWHPQPQQRLSTCYEASEETAARPVEDESSAVGEERSTCEQKGQPFEEVHDANIRAMSSPCNESDGKHSTAHLRCGGANAASRCVAAETSTSIPAALAAAASSQHRNAAAPAAAIPSSTDAVFRSASALMDAGFLAC